MHWISALFFLLGIVTALFSLLPDNVLQGIHVALLAVIMLLIAIANQMGRTRKEPKTS